MLIFYLVLQLKYCITVNFVLLVVYFMYCFWSVSFHIKTHTHFFMFKFHLSTWSIIISYFWFFEVIINIVKTILNYWGKKKGKCIVLFVINDYNGHILSVLIFCCWCVISYFIFDQKIFALRPHSAKYQPKYGKNRPEIKMINL